MNHLPYFTKLLRLIKSKSFFFTQSLFIQKKWQLIIISCLLLKVSILPAEKALLVIDYLRDDLPIQQQTIPLHSDSSTNQYIPVKIQVGENNTLLFQIQLPKLATLSDQPFALERLKMKDTPSIQVNTKQTPLLTAPSSLPHISCGSAHLFDHSLSILLFIYGIFYLLKEGNNYWQTVKIVKSKQLKTPVKFSDKQENMPSVPSTTIKEAPTSSPSELSMEEINWLVNLQQTVDRNISNIHFDIAQLAHDLAISSRHLNRRIRSYTGFSTHQYIQETRLTTAKKLLEEQAFRSVKVIAYEVGYKDVKYFGQLYKKRFGRLPSTYFKKQQLDKAALLR